MKKLLILTFLVLIGISANAQMLYNGIYWVDGTITAPTNDATVTTNGRMVVFYQTTPGDGYATDLSGPTGISGQTGKFMLNAMEDWRMSIVPGTYVIATVKGTDNYGVNPVSISISGKGWDAAPALQLAYGAGITMPGPRTLPSWLASEIPVIKNIWFDGKLYQKILVEDPTKPLKFYSTAQPKISVKVTAGNIGIDESTLAVTLDEGAASQKTFSTFSDVSRVMGPTAPSEVNFSLNFKTLGETLTDGSHTFKFYAGNAVGTTLETSYVTVKSALEVVGTPITFPSPLHLSTDTQVTFQYGLSKDANVDIYVFDISGTIVKKISCNAGGIGGSAGGAAGPNKVVWDLTTDQGSRLGVGIYVWEIVNRDSNKVIGKGKFAAAP